jgi:hypothetical protein
MKEIFFASDTMISTGDMSADMSAFKFRSIGDHWMALYAGNDISHVTPVTREVRNKLRGQPDTLENVQNAFVEAFHLELEKKAENEILRPLGFSLKEFKQEGMRLLGQDNFTRLMIEVQQQTIDIQFLVGGFDNGDPYVFTVSAPGKISDYSELGFWAIGSGQTNALGSIFNSGAQMRYEDEETHLYRLLEAKFNSETAIGVGRHTSIIILNSDTERMSLVLNDSDKIRQIWDETRVKVVPEKGCKRASELIAEAKKMSNSRKRRTRSVKPRIQTPPLATGKPSGRP